MKQHVLKKAAAYLAVFAIAAIGAFALTCAFKPAVSAEESDTETLYTGTLSVALPSYSGALSTNYVRIEYTVTKNGNTISIYLKSDIGFFSTARYEYSIRYNMFRYPDGKVPDLTESNSAYGLKYGANVSHYIPSTYRHVKVVIGVRGSAGAVGTPMDVWKSTGDLEFSN